jgi:hypothetical protein
LWEQVTDPVKHLAGGIAQFGTSVVADAVGLPRTLAAALSGDDRALADLAMTGGNANNLRGLEMGRALQARVNGEPLPSSRFPLSANTAVSFRDSADRLANPSKYQQAVREGRIVDVVLEDLGNVSLVAGPAGKALAGAGVARGAGTAGASANATRLLRAGTGLERAAKLGGEIADLGFDRALRATSSSLRRGLNVVDRRVVGRIGADGVRQVGALERWANNEANPRRQAFAQRARASGGMYLTPEGRQVREQALRPGVRRGNKATAQTTERMYRLQQVANELSGGDPNVEAVAFAIVNGVGSVDQLVQSEFGWAPEQARQAQVWKDFPEQTFTAEAQQAYRAYQDGTAPQGFRDAVDAVVEGVRRETDIVTQGRLEGYGSTKTLDPQQLDDAAMDSPVLAALSEVKGPAGRRVYNTDDLAEIADLRTQLGMSWEDLAGYIPELASILDDPQVYPARWRPALRSARLANEVGLGEWDAWNQQMLDNNRAMQAIADSGGQVDPAVFERVMRERLALLDSEPNKQRALPIRPEGLMARGVESPGYLPGSQSELVRPKGLRSETEPTNQGTWGIRGHGSNKQRVSSEFQTYSIRTFAEAVAKDLSISEMNKALMDVVTDPDLLPKVTSHIPEGELADIRARAELEANAAVRGTDGDAKLEAKIIAGRMIVERLAEQGYEIWQGNIESPQVGDFNPREPIRFQDVTGDEIVLPSGVKRRLEQHVVGKDLNQGLAALRYVNRKFKGAVLPFSLRWQLGDLVGGAFMGWLGGGIPPTEMARQLSRIKAGVSEGVVQNVFTNKDFVDSGITFAEQEQLYGREGMPEPRTAIGRFQQGSFKLNNSINRLNRQSYVLAKLDRVLQKQGLSLDMLDDPNVQAGWDTPEVQAAVQEAVVDANKVLGTFDELTPFESRWLKNIFPFYVWMRHITALTMRTAIDNPARLMWTMRLGSLGIDPDAEDWPAWLRGAITIPDRFMPDFLVEGDALVNLNFLNPVADSIATPVGLPSNLAAATSPALKVLAAGTLGIDLSKGGRQITRPYGMDRNPFTDALYQGLSSFPVTREAMNVSGVKLGPVQVGPDGRDVANIGLGPHPRYRSGNLIVDDNGNPIDTSSRWLSVLGLTGIPKPISVEDAQSMAPGLQRSAASPSERSGRTRRTRRGRARG